ncbi:MAG: ABC transporter substrate-binding protein [Eubacteriales bacterium]|nr:ABC transporter substrate-binding protein [Eubacteriales bacterium]
MKFTKITASILSFLLFVSLFTFIFAEEKQYRIGIAQFAVHGSLDNCREGFLKGLAEEGFIKGKNLFVDIQNAQADMGLAAQIADSFLAQDYDLVCAIATPIAVVCSNTFEDSLPMVYCAVSDPVSAGLATDDRQSLGNFSGTSDELPVDKQLKMIRSLMPKAKTLGLIYTIGEANSAVQVEKYKELAPKYGFNIKAVSVTQGADIALALPSLVNEADCLSMVLDNTVVQYLDLVLEEAENAGIPVFGSEIEQVIRGCAAAEGIEYIDLGVQTGHMAAKALKRERLSETPFETIQESKLYINSEQLRALNLELTEDMKARSIDVLNQQ